MVIRAGLKYVVLVRVEPENSWWGSSVYRMPKECVVPWKALASSAPGCSALTSWICFSSEGLDLVKTTIAVLKEMCISSPYPFNGKVFGTVLVNRGKQDSFLPQKFGFDEVWWTGGPALWLAMPLIGTLEGLGSQGIPNSFPCYRPWFVCQVLQSKVHVFSWF